MLLNCGVGEDSWESLGLQGDKPVNPKGNQSWMFIRRTDAEAETLILWPPDGKNRCTGKDPDAGKDWRWVEKGTIEDEMVGWHHRLNGYEFEQALGAGGGQGGLVCCSPWGHKELDTTEQLNWTELNWLHPREPQGLQQKPGNQEGGTRRLNSWTLASSLQPQKLQFHTFSSSGDTA